MERTLIECREYDREFRLFNVYRNVPKILSYITDHGFEMFTIHCRRTKEIPPVHEDLDTNSKGREIGFHRWRMVDALRKQMEQRGIEV